METVKVLVKRTLPEPVFNSLKAVWALRKYVKPFKYSGPVVQLYISDGETSSYLGINNFFSFLVADVSSRLLVELKLYDSSGKLLVTHHERMKNFGAQSVSVDQLMMKYNVKSPFGVVTLRMKPSFVMRKSYQSLGVVASHFFMFYKSKSGSVAHVHPSSILDLGNTVSGEFISNQNVSTQGLKNVTLYQVNPTFSGLEVTHEIFDASKGVQAVLKSERFQLNSLAVHKTVFDMKSLSGNVEFVGIRVNPLPSSNSKPLLLRYYAGDAYSLSHS